MQSYFCFFSPIPAFLPTGKVSLGPAASTRVQSHISSNWHLQKFPTKEITQKGESKKRRTRMMATKRTFEFPSCSSSRCSIVRDGILRDTRSMNRRVLPPTPALCNRRICGENFHAVCSASRSGCVPLVWLCFPRYGIIDGRMCVLHFLKKDSLM